MTDCKTKSVWIVFTGKTDIGWLKVLKPGFRHCYALIHDGYKWLSIDPLASHTDVETYHLVSPDYDLPAWLEYQGSKIIHVPSSCIKRKAAPPGFFSCVEMMKRLIGLHNPFIITPWQLYQFLKNNNLQAT
jgi:hypothetical protein